MAFHVAPFARRKHETSSPRTEPIAVYPRQEYVTKTIFTGPTPGADNPSSSSKGGNFPIAAVAGGVAAGIAVVVIAIVGWKWWGRSIDRKAREERHRRAEIRNLRNAEGMTRIRSHSDKEEAGGRFEIVHPPSMHNSRGDSNVSDNQTSASDPGSYSLPALSKPISTPSLSIPEDHKSAFQYTTPVNTTRNYVPFRPSPLAQASRIASPLPPSHGPSHLSTPNPENKHLSNASIASTLDILPMGTAL